MSRTTTKACCWNDVPEDIFTELAGQLVQVVQIFTLRLVCRRFYTLSASRSLWATLALDLVINKGLPWPRYATPLSEVPTATIERLTIGALRRNMLWNEPRLEQAPERGPSGLIQCSPGQITWLHLIRTKWVIAGLKPDTLALWDLENPSEKPLAYYHGTIGFSTSGVTLSQNQDLTLIVNTSKHHTYTFDMDLPYLGVAYEGQLPTRNFLLRNSFSGYSGLLDVFEGLLAFARSTTENLPVIFDTTSGAVARLARGVGVTKLQHNVAVQIRSDIIIVAKDLDLELYAMTSVEAILRYGGGGRAIDVQPLQSLKYPGSGMLWRISLRPSMGDGSTRRGDIVVQGYKRSRWSQWVVRKISAPEDIMSNGQLSSDYTTHGESSYRHNVLDGIAQVQWGESGAFLVYVGGWDQPARLNMLKSPGPNLEPQDPLKWTLPYDEDDVAWFCDFDETMGLSVVGTTRGRIWIMDMSSRLARAPSEWETDDDAFVATDYECALVD